MRHIDIELIKSTIATILLAGLALLGGFAWIIMMITI